MTAYPSEHYPAMAQAYDNLTTFKTCLDITVTHLWMGLYQSDVCECMKVMIPANTKHLHNIPTTSAQRL